MAQKIEQPFEPFEPEKFANQEEGERRDVKHQERGKIDRHEDHQRMPDKLRNGERFAARRVAIGQFDGERRDHRKQRDEHKGIGERAFADEKQPEQQQNKKRRFHAIQQGNQVIGRRAEMLSKSEHRAGCRHGKQQQKRDGKVDWNHAFKCSGEQVKPDSREHPDIDQREPEQIPAPEEQMRQHKYQFFHTNLPQRKPIE